MSIFKNSLLLLIFLLLASIAEANNGYEAWRQQVLNELDARITDPTEPPTAFDYSYGQLSKDGGRSLAELRIKESDVYMDDYADDPVLHYIQGNLRRRTHTFFRIDMRKEKNVERLFGSEDQALIKEYQSYYRKALDLDEVSDAPIHLTSQMLGMMADDVLATPDIKERAYKKELELVKSGEFVSENENYEWSTYEFLLGSYVEQKDYDNYLKTVNEMIERFGSTEELESYKLQAIAAIEKRDREAAGVAPTVEAVNAKAAAEANQQPEVVVQPPAAEKASESDNNLWLLLGGGVVLVLGAIVFVLRRRKPLDS